ncbi:MAG: hypothetical protein INR62_09155, partial [Rhodospirillales bacterium]|nr:hypothetical protein [Acetobacter sp.]
PADDVDVFFKIRAPQDSARRIRCYPGNGMGLFASHDYLRVASSLETPEDLSKHSCIGAGPWTLIRDQTIKTPDVKFLVEARDPHMNLKLVLDGLGIVLLPLWMARWPEVRDQIAPVLPSWKVEANSISALFFGPARQTPKVNALLEFLDEYIGTEKDPRLRKQKWAEDLFPTSRAAHRGREWD